MQPIADVAAELGLSPTEFRPFGGSIGKVPVRIVRERASHPRRGKLILISGMTPTKFGEGKTVTAIGLAMALRAAGKSAVVCLRQPSLGPVFGVKGGAAGGGRATVEPVTEINLGLTGDLHACAEAHNLLSSLIDNQFYFGNEMRLEPTHLLWPRTLDIEDRVLRHIVTGIGGAPRDFARESRFVITPASEVTAILGLAKDYTDLKERLGRILVAWRAKTEPVRARDFQAAGAMAALLRDALEPNLLQANDGTPAIIHGGPFGNIAHGTCSRLAIELGLATADYCVVEAGFATDLGAEKFVNIVTRLGGFSVSAGVLVTTIRALRHHGGVSDDEIDRANPEALRKGLANLEQHVSNLKAFGIEPIIALNRFPGDSEEEVRLVNEFAAAQGVGVAPSSVFSDGAAGGQELAERVIEAAARGRSSRPIYGDDTPVEKAVEMVVTRIYGGAGVTFDKTATEELARLRAAGEASGPVCIAKTQVSLSDDPKVRGRPRGFTPTVRRVSRSSGAGWTVVYLGDIETMPGLPRHPLSEKIDLKADGTIVGLG
jgi:formate--tetrahydrofolate ligase